MRQVTEWPEGSDATVQEEQVPDAAEAVAGAGVAPGAAAASRYALVEAILMLH